MKLHQKCYCGFLEDWQTFGEVSYSVLVLRTEQNEERRKGNLSVLMRVQCRLQKWFAQIVQDETQKG